MPSPSVTPARARLGLAAAVAAVLQVTVLAIAWWQTGSDAAATGSARAVDKVFALGAGLPGLALGLSVGLALLGAALARARRRAWFGAIVAMLGAFVALVPLWALGHVASRLVSGPSGDRAWLLQCAVAWAIVALPAAIAAVTAEFQARDQEAPRIQR